jgi:DNA-directed RNA polymerase specialized sigma24 family protein
MVALKEFQTEILAQAAREKRFTDLYENAFPMVATFVSHRNGSFQEAKDIFQDALVIFYENAVNGKLPATCSENAYVLGIAKHLWIRKFNRDKSVISLDALEQAIAIPEDYFPTIQTSKLVAFLGRAGDKCMQLLRSFYYDRQKISDITEAFGYGTERSATVQKFKCLEKVREVVKEKSLTYEDFVE